jgi:hypothetical protein
MLPDISSLLDLKVFFQQVSKNIQIELIKRPKLATAIFSVAALGVSFLSAKMYDLSMVHVIKTFDYSYLVNLHNTETQLIEKLRLYKELDELEFITKIKQEIRYNQSERELLQNKVYIGPLKALKEEVKANTFRIIKSVLHSKTEYFSIEDVER